MGRFSGTIIISDDEGDDEKVQFLGRRPTAPLKSQADSSSTDRIKNLYEQVNNGGSTSSPRELTHSTWKFPATRVKSTEEDKNKYKIDESNNNIPEHDPSSRQTKRKRLSDVTDVALIDLEDYESELEAEMIMLDGPLEAINVVRSGRKSTVIPQRNPPVNAPFVQVDTATTTTGIKIRPGMIYELLHQQDFILVKVILKNLENGDILLRGLKLQRSRDLNGMLPKKLNELCVHVEIELDDERDYLEQALIEISIHEIMTKRQTRFTNRPFPECSWRQGGMIRKDEAEISGDLTARWLYTCSFLTARHRANNRYNERSLQRMTQNILVDLKRSGHDVPDSELRNEARGVTIAGGSFIPVNGKRRRESSVSNISATHFYEGQAKKRPYHLKAHQDLKDIHGQVEGVREQVSRATMTDGESFNFKTNRNKATQPQAPQPQITHPQHSIVISNLPFVITPPDSGMIPGARKIGMTRTVRQPGQAYTYGDAFCGAGGATRGAVMAGLKPQWGFDFNEHASRTWRMNFPEAKMYTLHSHEFVLMGKGNAYLKVDILHLSPPCQFFSPAHTVIGRHDDHNSASMFACGEVLKMTQPRIFTLEETFGIMSPKFLPWFNAAVQMFTELNYSVRWKIVPLQEWGLPQRRLRLFMIGACPGEVLPNFPPTTHNVDGTNGKKKFVSVNDAICNIPLNTPDHDVRNTIERALPPWDGNQIAPRCITTSGGQNYHPSGRRDLTNREFAALQGFPNSHVFSGIEVRKQIGNAVPPPIAMLLFSHIKKHLEKTDGVEPEVEEPILVDDKADIVDDDGIITIDD